MKAHLMRVSLETLVLLLALAAGSVQADGKLTHLSGKVSLLKLEGREQPATVGARVHAGETVVTGAGGYVRMEMSDGSEMVLRPDSQLMIEDYKYFEGKPAEDSFIFSMLKGGLRTVTGLIGKRGNRDAYKLKTSTATVGIRGTQFDLRVCQANCGALPDGTYLAVRFGAVQTSNAQGSLGVSAGQVAHVPPQKPPVMLPRDPGIGFTPPPAIPKLDEKKKVQATTATAPSDQPKPGAGGQATQDKQKGGQAPGNAAGRQDKSEGANPDAPKDQKDSGDKGPTGSRAADSADSNRTGAAVIASFDSAQNQTPAGPSPTSSSPASTSSAGTECSVQ